MSDAADPTSAPLLAVPSFGHFPPHVHVVAALGGAVVCTPQNAAYGHQLIEFMHGLAIARMLRAPLVVQPKRPLVNDALGRLEAEGVAIVSTGLRRRLITTAYSVQETRDLLGQNVWSELYHSGLEASQRPARWSRAAGKSMRMAASERQSKYERPKTDSYKRRRLLRDPFNVSLSAEAEREARALARALGVPDDGPIVCLHVREPTFKRDREAQDKGSPRNDATRNASLESYFPACDRLVREGFTVIRFGDRKMQPLVRRGYCDLATSPHHCGLLELHLMLRAKLLVASESGVGMLAYLTDTPILTVNATDLISSFPIRVDGHLLVKGITRREDGWRLSAADLLGFAYQEMLRDTQQLRYMDNDPDEIGSAVAEACDWIDGGHVESDEQRRFREFATSGAITISAHSRYARKWGPDEGFLGDGRVVGVQAHLYPIRP